MMALITDPVFHDDKALPLAMAWVAGPSTLLGWWLIASGLKPFARTRAVQGLLPQVVSARSNT